MPEAGGGLTAGQRPDAPPALTLLDGLAPAFLIADRGNDSDPFVAALAARGTCAVMPPRGKRRTPRAYDVARDAQPTPWNDCSAALSSSDAVR